MNDSYPTDQKTSFFEKFTKEEIFKEYIKCSTLIELATKLGYKSEYLARVDYEYINKIKTRDVWLMYIKKGNFEQERNSYVKNIESQDLIEAMHSPGIKTVSHLATHFLLSQRHGRNVLLETIKKLQLVDYIPDELYKGFFNVSKNPWYYPARMYEKRKGPKSSTCQCCGFKAIDQKQMEIHHLSSTGEGGEKLKGTPGYYKTTDVEVICANCHTLEHRTGDDLMNKCGIWHRNPPLMLSYDNPYDIFFDDCPFDHTTQKRYYISWYLKKPEDYKCQKCGVTYWGPQKKILVLELNHIDGIRKHSNLSNLELLCPNCHRLVHTTEKKGQPQSTTEKPQKHRVYLKPEID